MQVRFHADDPLARDIPLLVAGVPEGRTSPDGFLARLDDHLRGAVARALEAGDLRGKPEDEIVFYGGEGGPRRIALLGLGKPEDFDAERARRLAGRAVRLAERLRVDALALRLPDEGSLPDPIRGQAAAEGVTLAAWRFTELKHPPDDEPRVAVERADLFGDGDPGALAEGVRVGEVIGRGENAARTLQSRPGNLATPSHLAAEAQRIAAEVGLAVTVFDEEALRREGMHAILAVSSGSTEEARLIVLEHRGGRRTRRPSSWWGRGSPSTLGGSRSSPPPGWRT